MQVAALDSLALEHKARFEAAHPRLTRCRVELHRLDGATCEAHVELLLPEHQIIVNRAHPDARAALDEALRAAEARLQALARRDPLAAV